VTGVDTRTPVVVLDPGDTAYSIARSLGRFGVEVWGVHRDAGAAGRRSRYWTGLDIFDAARATPPDALDWLRRFATRFSRTPILIPTDDSSALFVADHAADLRELYLFPHVPKGMARSLSSKKGMYALCREHEIPTPETLFPESREDVLAFLDRVRFPVMLKGIYTYAVQDRTGVRMVEVQDAASLLQQYDRMETPGRPSVMLQEYIPAQAEDNWMFDGYFGAGSACLFGLAGQKLRQYPPYRGRTSLGVIRRNSELVGQIQHFMRLIGYQGVLDIGYRYDARTRQYKLLDVNPRVGMTFRLFEDRSGLDVVRALYLDLTGQQPEGGWPGPEGRGLPEGRKWVAEDVDAVSSWRYLRDGGVRFAQWIRSFQGVEEACWFDRDDPGPFLARANRIARDARSDLGAWWRSRRLPRRGTRPMSAR
jgi:predicted ATP-grasp superfamily ATP-dependent carboligase